MDCYNDLSPSREVLFAIGNVRILPSRLDATPIRRPFKNWRSIMPVKSFSGFLCISYHRSNPPNNEVNTPISCHTDWVTALRA
jgi:hypothetical protein